MKQGKKLTREMKERLSQHEKVKDVNDWLYCKNTKEALVIQNKITGEIVTILK